MLDSQKNVVLIETTCCLHVGVPLRTPIRRPEINRKSAVESFFFFKKSDRVNHAYSKNPEKRSQKAKAPFTG